MAKKDFSRSKKSWFGNKTPMGTKSKMKKTKKRTDGIMNFAAIKRSLRMPWSFGRRTERKPDYYSESMKFLRVLPRKVFAGR